MSRVEVFKTKKEAKEQATKSAETHGKVSVISNEMGGYIIKKHAANCRCGMCPVLMTNGFFE